jgi:hypothetical protein
MKNNNFYKEKKIINENIKDITTIWYCTPYHRAIAHKNNIFSWDDKKLNAELLGFKNTKAQIINGILDINRSDKDIIIVRKYLENNNKNILNIYIDFECFNTAFNSQITNGKINVDKDYIYMIGIGYITNKWIYKSFILDNLESSDNIFVPLFFYLRSLLRLHKKTHIKFYHWSNYEKYKFNSFKKNINLCLTDDKYDFNDLCDFFEKNVSIKDAFNFKLKTIGSALYKHNIIDTHYESNCTNGLDASISALELYKTKNKVSNNPVMKDIEHYNEIDCKLVYELHTLVLK